MPVTLTVKQVPDAIAEGLRRRAASNRRSLQRELLLIIERAAAGEFAVVDTIAAPGARPYLSRDHSSDIRKHSRKSTGRSPLHGKLDLEQLWQRARTLGESMPGESTGLIRRDRDARHRR